LALAVVAAVGVLLAGAGCGASGVGAASGGSPSASVQAQVKSPGAIPGARPQAIEPTVGQQAPVAGVGSDPVGDPNAHAVPLAEVKRELKLVQD